MGDLNRINKELRDCMKDCETSGLEVALVDKNNPLHWKGKIKGPLGTPYENGVFCIDIQLPPDYPFVPPKMRYLTKIWHPNISSESGAICLDILKNEWSPALTVRTALISLQALMSAPEPGDPQDAVVANQYKADYKKFVSTAQFWTETYAIDKGQEAKVKNLMEMGFSRDIVCAALEEVDYDEERALNKLLG